VPGCRRACKRTHAASTRHRSAPRRAPARWRHSGCSSPSVGRPGTVARAILRPAWPRCWRSAGARWLRGRTQRWSRSRAASPSRSAPSWPNPAASCVIFLAALGCERRWGRGTTRQTSTGCWRRSPDDSASTDGDAGEVGHDGRYANTSQMTSSQQTDAVRTAPPTLAQPVPIPARRYSRTTLLAHPALRHLALAPVLVVSSLLNLHRLSQNGYANIFYSGGVRSMLRSLHNFVFVSFDSGGLVMVDKPPLGLWLQAASAKLFGFSPLSLLLPEAIAGILTVALLYYLLARRFGLIAGLAGALALAVFPSFVAVSRDNGVDPLLILLMALACAAGLWAAESGRWRALLCSAVLVGLAFNTKTLAAYLVVPGIALAYAVCAPGSALRRVGQLAVAGLVMAAVSFSWITFVELPPASARPYVGGSTDNTELGLTFEYNGFGRVGGQVGGPGRVQVKPGAIVHTQPVLATSGRGAARTRAAPRSHRASAEARRLARARRGRRV